MPCEPDAGPPPISGELAEPAVVWERVTRLIEGEGAPPPSNLPATTTYAWVGDIVTQAFQRARLEGTVDGAEAFVNYWLFRTTTPAEPALGLDWGASLIESEPVLEQLMLQPVGEHGYGVFSEPTWLVRFPTISARGAGILARVFGNDPPAPPANTPTTEPSETLTRRQELRAALDSLAPCESCHLLFDELGYPYGHFDELGAYEALDDGLPIDTSGQYAIPAGTPGLSFADVQELGVEVAASCEARKGIALAFARAALGLEGFPLGTQYELVEPQRNRLQLAFLASAGRSYEDLVRAYAQSPLVLQR